MVYVVRYRTSQTANTYDNISDTSSSEVPDYAAVRMPSTSIISNESPAPLQDSILGLVGSDLGEARPKPLRKVVLVGAKAMTLAIINQYVQSYE